MDQTNVVHLSYLRSLIDYLRGRNLPLEPLLHQTGLSKADIADSGRLVPAAAADAAFQAAERITRDPHIGMHLGMSLRPRDLGVVGTLVLTCSNSGELFSLHRRFCCLLATEGAPEYGVDGEHAWVRLACGREQCRHMTDFDVFGWLATARWLIRQDFVPERVDFSYTACPSPEEMTRFLGCPVSFGSDETRIYFPTRLLAQRLIHMSRVRTTLEEEAWQQLRDWQGPIGHPVPVLADVRQFLAETLGMGVPEIYRAADSAGMSVGRLRGVLDANGLSYELLVDNLRKDLAGRYIREPRLTIVDVGLLLGFDDLDDYQQTFVRWFGCDPRAFRQPG